MVKVKCRDGKYRSNPVYKGDFWIIKYDPKRMIIKSDKLHLIESVIAKLANEGLTIKPTSRVQPMTQSVIGFGKCHSFTFSSRGTLPLIYLKG